MRIHFWHRFEHSHYQHAVDGGGLKLRTPDQRREFSSSPGRRRPVAA
jgi:hypothetical protein